MKLVITGANGLLGQKLLALLNDQPEMDVHAVARGEDRNPAGGRHRYHSVDLTDAAATLSLLDNIQPEAIIHTAAMTHVDQCEQNPEECQKQNVDVVKTLIQACEKHNAFLTHLSTDFIFDGTDGPYAETDTPNPLSVYGQSKLDAEKLLEASDIRWAAARTILVYGVVHDLSRSNIVLWIKKSLEDGKSIKLINDQWRMPTLAEDLAMGCWLITQKQARGVFNISGPDLLNPYQMGLKVAEVFDLDASLITETDGSEFTQPARRPPKTGFVLDKARNELGYHPHTFEEGVQMVKKQLALFQS